MIQIQDDSDPREGDDMSKIKKIIFVVILALVTAGCDSVPIKDWIKQATSFQTSATKSVKSAYDLRLESHKSTETHKFLTDFRRYEPLKDCKPDLESGIYEKERDNYENRVKLLKKLADYASKLDKLLDPNNPDKKTVVGEMIDVTESIIGSAKVAALASPWGDAANAGVKLLKKTYKYYQEQNAIKVTYDFIAQENGMISSLTLQLSEVLLTLDKEATADKMAWASCQADSLNFAKHMLPKDSSKTVALLELKDRHSKFLDQRQAFDEKIAEISSMQLEKDEQGLIKPLAALKNKHEELARGPQISVGSIAGSYTDLKEIASAIEALYNAFPKSSE